MMSHGDLVSCLMLALPVPQRFAMMKRAVGCYLRQTHPTRELVVVLDQGPGRDEYLAYFEQLQRNDIRLIVPPSKLDMVALRNASLDEARGEVICQWDDDDVHHPQRIEAQLSLMRRDNADAVYLEDVLQFFPARRELFWTNWRKTPSGGHQATLLCRRDVRARYTDEGVDYRTSGEDEAFRRQLSQMHKVTYLRAQAQLYVYFSHGQNLMPQELHQMLATSLVLSRGLVLSRKKIIIEAWRILELEEWPVKVMCRDGVAFTFPDSSFPVQSTACSRG